MFVCFQIILIVMLGLVLAVNVYQVVLQRELQDWQHSRYTDEFNCVEMSAECQEFFVEKGIPSSIVYGTNHNLTLGHCWLKLYLWYGDVEFESTLLRFKGDDQISEKYYRSLNVEDRI